VVIKSLGDTMKNIPGISGGAIMPDGRVGLILDVGGLLRFVTPDRREDAGFRNQALAA
jgi:chemotaxis protein histidine kinase CheA